MDTILLTDYLKTFVPKRDSLLKQMEQEGLEDKIPIADPQTAGLLYLLAKMHNSRRVLEIGTATGYSTIWLARAVAPLGRVTTIEINHLRHRRAREYFQRAGLDNIITAYLGDALNILPQLPGDFDFIFMDAAKGQYISFFDYAYKLLVPGGILVADNVLFKGMVATGAKYPRRKRTLVVRLRKFLRMLNNHPNLVTSILPLGDGVALCLKERKELS
ncbi:O-methyltransferase [Desulfitibacter alkalitolerans]|uniref:O-methyltransferase n=1 Tax=Desulfitibacter alkalitolerans TaxID=264641 RepID=UPI00047FB11E|nr:O-methyltransferase [Desulfitibacter alkalitolerans]